MPQVTFYAKDYNNRGDLEMDINSLVGQDSKDNKKDDHLIEGTRAELKKLSLDDRRTVFGIKCVATDLSTTQILKKKKNG